MVKLKPCPFCGYKARVKTTRDAIGDYQGYVECMDCGATLFGAGDLSEADDAKRDAVGAWNRRAERTCRAVDADVERGYLRRWRCSECGEVLQFGHTLTYRYCPWCGARAVDQ